MNKSEVYFAPQLIVRDVKSAVEFYQKAFNVTELRRWNNDDGTIHVAELSFGSALFHVKEESIAQQKLSPGTAGGFTTIIGIFVNDVDTVVTTAIAAGATLVSAAQDFDYGYRQADVMDPFGHQWLIEKKI